MHKKMHKKTHKKVISAQVNTQVNAQDNKGEMKYDSKTKRNRWNPNKQIRSENKDIIKDIEEIQWIIGLT